MRCLTQYHLLCGILDLSFNGFRELSFKILLSAHRTDHRGEALLVELHLQLPRITLTHVKILFGGDQSLLSMIIGNQGHGKFGEPWITLHLLDPMRVIVTGLYWSYARKSVIYTGRLKTDL